MNYGTTSAQYIFDKAMDDTIEGFSGVMHVRNNVIVFGKNNEEHDYALQALLQRFLECRLTFNPRKGKFVCTKYSFLAHKDCKWKRSSDEQQSFEALQNAFSCESVLRYYGQATKLKVEARPNGLGLILLQKKGVKLQPIECASRSMTETEKRHSQLEKEALAIRWACERCYIYVVGSSFVVDHKPLIPLSITQTAVLHYVLKDSYCFCSSLSSQRVTV